MSPSRHVSIESLTNLSKENSNSGPSYSVLPKGSSTTTSDGSLGSLSADTDHIHGIQTCTSYFSLNTISMPSSTTSYNNFSSSLSATVNCISSLKSFCIEPFSSASHSLFSDSISQAPK